MLQPSWVGRRVSVRRVVDRAPDGRLLLGDVVGRLAGLDAQTAVVDGRDGLVEVPIAFVTAARLVPASTADELALQAIAARGLRAAETQDLDGWLLRADGGFLRRANSALPLRQLQIPLSEAVAQARAWYAERGLPLQLQLPTEARRLLDADLGERGWAPEAQAGMYAADLPTVLRSVGTETSVQLADAPDNGWLARYRDGAADFAAGRALLTRHDRVTFASVRRGGLVVAVGRGTVDDGWLGISAVEVAPDLRRQGLAAAVLGALGRWGAGHDAVSAYVQVESGNAAAIALYEKHGFWLHHEYRYRVDPG